MIGLFFGSFNPIHIGHLIVANVLYENSDMKEVWFVVTPQNPLKKKSNLVPEFDRLDMVRAAIHNQFHFRASDVEFHLPKPSYTVDTLAYLADQYPDKDFRVIVGEDNLFHFPKWKNHQVILEEFGLIVYPRKNSKQSSLVEHTNVQKVDAPGIEISATLIRQLIRDNKSIKYLVPDDVAKIIQSRGLFR